MTVVTIVPNAAGTWTQLHYATGASHYAQLNIDDNHYVATNPTAYKPGDADLNGTVEMADVTRIQRVILGLDPSTDECDFNQDGTTDSGDVTNLQNHILGAYTFLTRIDLYNLQNPSIPVGAIINSVTANWRIRGGPSGLSVVEAVLYLAGNYSYSFAYTTTTSWADKSYAMNRPGGGSWGYTDFTDLQAGFRMIRATSSNAKASELSIDIDYTEALEKSLMAVIG